jgi:hypothetical protein
VRSRLLVLFAAICFATTDVNGRLPDIKFARCPGDN